MDATSEDLRIAAIRQYLLPSSTCAYVHQLILGYCTAPILLYIPNEIYKDSESFLLDARFCMPNQPKPSWVCIPSDQKMRRVADAQAFLHDQPGWDSVSILNDSQWPPFLGLDCNFHSFSCCLSEFRRQGNVIRCVDLLRLVLPRQLPAAAFQCKNNNFKPTTLLLVFHGWQFWSADFPETPSLEWFSVFKSL